MGDWSSTCTLRSSEQRTVSASTPGRDTSHPPFTALGSPSATHLWAPCAPLRSTPPPKKEPFTSGRPGGLSWTLLPFQRRQPREPGCGDRSPCLPGFASPSYFPSRSFSLPQGIASRAALQPCFMPQPLIGSAYFGASHLWRPPKRPTTFGSRSLPVCAFRHRSGESAIPRYGPARCLPVSPFGSSHEGPTVRSRPAVVERSRSGASPMRPNPDGRCPAHPSILKPATEVARPESFRGPPPEGGEEGVTRTCLRLPVSSTQPRAHSPLPSRPPPGQRPGFWSRGVVCEPSLPSTEQGTVASEEAPSPPAGGRAVRLQILVPGDSAPTSPTSPSYKRSADRAPPGGRAGRGDRRRCQTPGTDVSRRQEAMGSRPHCEAAILLPWGNLPLVELGQQAKK